MHVPTNRGGQNLTYTALMAAFALPTSPGASLHWIISSTNFHRLNFEDDAACGAGLIGTVSPEFSVYRQTVSGGSMGIGSLVAFTDAILKAYDGSNSSKR